MRIVLPILLLFAAMPAQAQIWDGGRTAGDTPRPRPGPTVGQDLADINRSIREGRRSGDLTRSEARQLRAQSTLLERAIDQRRDTPFPVDNRQLEQMALALRGLVQAQRLRGK
jgi:hypothetical protein